jgi:hypothetical protein
VAAMLRGVNYFRRAADLIVAAHMPSRGDLTNREQRAGAIAGPAAGLKAGPIFLTNGTRPDCGHNPHHSGGTRRRPTCGARMWVDPPNALSSLSIPAVSRDAPGYRRAGVRTRVARHTSVEEPATGSLPPSLPLRP